MQALEGVRALLAELGRAPLRDVLRFGLEVKQGDDLDSAVLKVSTIMPWPNACCYSCQLAV